MNDPIDYGRARKVVRQSDNPMDLIHFEMMVHLQEWAERLLSSQYVESNWVEFGWHLHSLSHRYENWLFLQHGPMIVRSAYAHDDNEVIRLGSELHEMIHSDRMALIEGSRSAIAS